MKLLITLLFLTATLYSQLINDAHTKYFYTWDTANGGIVDTMSPTGFHRDFLENRLIDSTLLSTTYPEYREQSFEFWVYMPSDPDTVGVIVNFSNLIMRAGDDPYYDISLNREGTEFSFYFGQFITGYVDWHTPHFQSLFDDKWHLISFVVNVNNKNVKLYIDGNTIMNRTYDLFYWYNTTTYDYTIIGGGYNSDANTFVGYMATVRISDTLRTASEILLTYNAHRYRNLPVITSTPSNEAMVYVEYTYTIDVSDLDISIGDSLTFSLVSSPLGMIINNNVVSWTPTLADTGEHTITIKAEDLGGNDTTQTFNITVNYDPTTITSLIDNNTSFSLEQNQPNPFNPTTSIGYSINSDGHVLLNIYDISGKLIRTMVNSNKPRGTHSVLWNNVNGSSGVYIYKLIFDNKTITRRMLLTK